MPGVSVLDDPLVELRADSPLSANGVREAVRLVADVARWNRNRTVRQVLCVTDSADVALRFITRPQRARAQLWPDSVWGIMGNTWHTHEGRGAAIWVSPVHQVHASPLEEAVTVAHELAHAVTRTVHGFTWRRMHAMTAAMVVDLVLPRAVPVSAFAFCRQVVYDYRRPAPGAGALRRDDGFRAEIRSHAAATTRCRQRFADQ